ncbi:Uncharacterized protein Rs2_03412 [Raphanus sativus]|nr:Uncharacterized protein Rs2_03412 [Raphanus sativus]
MEDYDITKTSARIRVLLESLEPLVMDSVVDFSSGEEVPISLEYESLANYCSICKKITHSSRYCDVNYRSLELPRNEPVSRRYSSREAIPPRHDAALTLSASRDQNEDFQQRVDRHGRPFGDRITAENSRVLPLKNKISPGIPPQARLPLSNPNSDKRPYASTRKSPQLPQHSQLQWRPREQTATPPNLPPPPLRRTPTTPVPPLERNLHESAFSKQPSIPSTEEVLGELRDVTLQYIHCADPTESAARRLRVIQSETQNLMANTATGIIAAATLASSQAATKTQAPPSVIILPQPTFSEQGPGPSTSSSGLPPKQTATKRRGRPPGPKKVTANAKCVGGSAKKRIFSKIQASPGC